MLLYPISQQKIVGEWQWLTVLVNFGLKQQQ
jgi:hypothetical protein